MGDREKCPEYEGRLAMRGLASAHSQGRYQVE